MGTQVFKIARGEFGLSLTDPGKTIEELTIVDFSDFSCRVTSGALTSEQNIETDEVPGTFCSPAEETNTPSATTFDLDLSLLQDPNEGTLAGLQKFLWDNDSGESGVPVYWFLGLAQGASPKASGRCWIAPIDFGGEPRVVLTADVEFPVEGRPDISWADDADPVEDLTGEVFGESPAPFDDLASLKADPVYGDGGTMAPSGDFTTGQFVRLRDQSTAEYSTSAWSAGVAALAAAPSRSTFSDD